MHRETNLPLWGHTDLSLKSCIWLKAGAWLAINPPFPQPISVAAAFGSIGVLLSASQHSLCWQPEFFLGNGHICPGPRYSHLGSTSSASATVNTSGETVRECHRYPPHPSLGSPSQGPGSTHWFSPGGWAGLGMGVGFCWLWARVTFHCLWGQFLWLWYVFFRLFCLYIIYYYNRSLSMWGFFAGSGHVFPETW